MIKYDFSIIRREESCLPPLRLGIVTALVLISLHALARRKSLLTQALGRNLSTQDFGHSHLTVSMPCSYSARMMPPVFSTRLCAMESPSPVLFFVRDLSAT